MPGLEYFGKMLMFFGLMLLVIGGFMYFGGKFAGLGRLPGDIFIQKDGFSFYFPLATSIIISVVLTLILTLINRR